MIHKRKLLSVLVPLTVFGASAPFVTAQEKEQLALEEVIVTARKRTESLQDVPLSVSAFSADQIAKRAYRDLQDISQATSGLVYEDFATSGLSTAPVIRGMGQTFTTSRIQNTGAFLDGIYLQRQSMVNPGLMDVERIEVLKGPQNAQYGRNAFAGAINYVTKKPTPEFNGDVGVVAGSGERRDIYGSVGGSIIKDKLFGRVFAGYTEFDGHTDNDHPFADDGPSGADATNDVLGGWEDESYALALTWAVSDRLELGFSYNRTESQREPQANYYLDGARYQFDTSEIAFGADGPYFTGPLGANCLDTQTFSTQQPFPASGNHAYCGELPFDPPVLEDTRLEEAGFGNTRGDIVVDPRSNVLDSESSITQFTLDYDFNDAMSMSYQYGYVDHEASNKGTAPGRSSLIGSVVPYLGVEELDVPPYIVQTGPFPGFNGTNEYATILNANPVEELEARSHELRFNWSSDPVDVRVGFYYSKNEDQDGGIFYFTPPCDSKETCRVAVDNQPNPLDGRYISVVPDPTDPNANVGRPHPFSDRSGVIGNHTEYEDEVGAIFGDVVWRINEAFSLTVEARYTQEEKSYDQQSSTFGFDLPDFVDASDDKTYNFFTPRVTLDWAITDFNMVYGLVAKGVKTGGFNAVDPRFNSDQATYDEEENLTYEIGTKNVLFNGALTLNAAFYYIDWTDIQGTEAASSPDAWTTDVVGNIGDATVTGFEIDGLWRVWGNFYTDFALSLTDPEYDDAIYQSSAAGPTSSWGCNDVECRSDGNVDGNQVERTAKRKANFGLNYGGELGGNWAWDARWDFNYRSKMYATPLNLADNGSRWLSNAMVSFHNANWDVTLWGKNVFDEEYVANSFVLPSFSRYIVSQGSARTYGLTLAYNW
jgi:outer membrane receptor protein involved in Fe transport